MSLTATDRYLAQTYVTILILLILLAGFILWLIRCTCSLQHHHTEYRIKPTLLFISIGIILLLIGSLSEYVFFYTAFSTTMKLNLTRLAFLFLFFSAKFQMIATHAVYNRTRHESSKREPKQCFTHRHHVNFVIIIMSITGLVVNIVFLVDFMSINHPLSILASLLVLGVVYVYCLTVELSIYRRLLRFIFSKSKRVSVLMLYRTFLYILVVTLWVLLCRQAMVQPGSYFGDASDSLADHNTFVDSTQSSKESVHTAILWITTLLAIYIHWVFQKAYHPHEVCSCSCLFKKNLKSQKEEKAGLVNPNPPSPNPQEQRRNSADDKIEHHPSGMAEL